MNTNEFIDRCIEYNKQNNIDISTFTTCPVHVWASKINIPCHTVNSGISYCKLCGKAVCSTCYNHNVTQISRVTGYMSSIEGWNVGKRQELKDRKHYNI